MLAVQLIQLSVNKLNSYQPVFNTSLAYRHLLITASYKRQFISSYLFCVMNKD